MENKNKSFPKLFSKATLSMILTSSMVLNSGYAAVATVKKLKKQKKLFQKQVRKQAYTILSTGSRKMTM